MTHAQATARGSWYSTIPAPLQRLFDAVPLVTYPPNELPYRSPGPTDLPTLHVFISDQDAARGSPSYNPSCLKWQAFLRIAGVRFHLRPSTNHASPTGALPFLQPPIPSISSTTTNPTTTKTNNPDATPATGRNHQRLGPRNHLLPVPSSRLEAYAAQHGALPPKPSQSHSQSQAQSRRRQAYQSLLDGPVRDAWLYSLYLSPANEHVLRRWYVDPVSRSGAVRDTVLRQLRRAVRAEMARSSSSCSATTAGVGSTGGFGWWSLSGSMGDVLAWAAGGAAAVDPSKVYAEAARALEALDTLLCPVGEEEQGPPPEAGGDGAGAGAGQRWFFGEPHPTVFDAAVFSYVYLILHGGDGPAPGARRRRQQAQQHGQGQEPGQEQKQQQPWADDTLRQILLGRCGRLIGHTQRILDEYWTDQVEQGWVEVSP